MAPSKKSQEEIRRKKRECEKRRRERIKSDPHLYEQAKAKERERYKKRKEEKKILPIGQMSERKQRYQRKEWRKRQKKCRENRKCRERFLSRLCENSPPPSDIENEPIRQSPSLSVTRSPSISRLRSRSVSSSQTLSISSRLTSPHLTSTFYRESSPSLLTNYSNIPQRLDSPSNCSLTSYQKKIGQKIAKRHRYIINKKVKVQEKIIESLKKKVNALRMKVSREKILAVHQKRKNPANQNHERVHTLREKKIAVKIFFEKDENGRLMAGKKDVITRNKLKKQKRLLSDSLGNLYKKFIAENPCQMSYATFCRLKPFWVLQAAAVRRDTSMCVLHENIKYIVEKLHFLRVLQYSSIDEVAKRVVCDMKSDSCVLRTCELCKDRVPIVNTFTDSPTYYKKWVAKKETRVINGNEKLITRTVKDTIQITKVDLVKLLIDLIPKFLIHKQIISNQYEYINELKKKLKTGEVLLHIDFSENYQTKYAQEIQSVHFGASRQQLTLHTVVAYYRDLSSDQIITRSFCTLSENLRHDARAVYAHILPVLHKINERSPIHSLHILSDAPSTQYRNKYMFFIFCNLMPKVFNLRKADWSFSAPGHGKGAPDGVGGYTKRTADRIVSQGKDITDIQTLYQALCSQESNITYMLVHDSDIEQIDSIVPKDLKPIRGTTNAYQISWSKQEDNSIFLRRLSCAKCDKDCVHYGIGKYTYSRRIDEESLPGFSDEIPHEVPEHTVIEHESNKSKQSQSPDLTSNRELIEGNWAVVKFVCKKTAIFYIGQIITVNNFKYLVKFLRKKKRDEEYTEFVWPQCEDISQVNDEDIVFTLPQPRCGRRDRFHFKNIWLSSFPNLR